MADFTWLPSFSYEPEDSFTTLVTKFENETVQRRPKVSTAALIWNLVFKNQTTVTKDEIKAFFRSKGGMATSFTWDEPDSLTEYTVYFGQDKVKWSNKSPGIWDFAFSFIQEI